MMEQRELDRENFHREFGITHNLYLTLLRQNSKGYVGTALDG